MRKIILLLLMSFAFGFYSPIINAMEKEPVKTEKEIPSPTKKLTKTQRNDLVKYLFSDRPKETDENNAIKLLESSGLDDPNYKIWFDPIIHSAISVGFVKLFDKLVNMTGLDINLHDRYNGDTLLHRAIKSEKLKETDRENIIEILINKGADPEITDRYRKKPIEYAKKEISEKIKKLMSPDQSKIKKISPVKSKKVKTESKITSPIKKIENKKYTKTYYDGTTANVFDVAILLDHLTHYERNQPHYEYIDPKETNVFWLNKPITRHLLEVIEAQEATIVSAPLFMNLYALYKKYTSNLISSLDDQDLVKTAINKLFKKGKFSIFATNDREFVLLIPNSKYREVKTVENLSTIGLNPNKFYKIKYSDEETLSIENIEKKLKAIYDDLFENQESRKNKSSFINIKSLLDIFLDTPVVEIRVFLGGHGLEKFKGALDSGLFLHEDERLLCIANMEPDDYIKLRKKLDSIGCSFLFVRSCYSGSTIPRVQSGNLNEMLDAPQSQPKHKMPEKPKILSSKKFIEIAEGIPGTATTAGKKPMNFDKFFLKINEFFTKEKEARIKELDEDKNINLDVKNSILNNLTEQQLLTGEFGPVNLEPVITKNKDIKTSTIFLDIFKDFVPKNSINLPKVRFPKDTKMSPLWKLYPEKDKKYREAAWKIFEQKEDELEIINFKIHKCEEEGDIPPNNIKKLDYENEKKILEDTIRQLEEDYLPKNTILKHKKDQLSRLYGKINTTKDLLKRKPSSENAQKWENEIKDFENSAQALETRIKELENQQELEKKL